MKIELADRELRSTIVTDTLKSCHNGELLELDKNMLQVLKVHKPS